MQLGIYIIVLIFSASHLMANTNLSKAEKNKMEADRFQLDKLNNIKDYFYKDSNNSDENPADKNTTNHKTNAVGECVKWDGPRHCAVSIPAMVSSHGYPVNGQGDVDASFSELSIGQIAKKNEGSDGSSGIYGVLAVDAQGSIVNREGKLKLKELTPDKITKLELLPEAEKAQLEIGKQTALVDIKKTKDLGVGNNIISDTESRSKVVLEYTKQMERNAIFTLGQIRTSVDPIEARIREGVDCAKWAKEAEKESQKVGEFRDDKQLPLEMATRNRDLEIRLDLCQQMLQASIFMPNPQVSGDQIAAGDPSQANIMEAKARAQIMALRKAGMTPEEMQGQVPGFKLTAKEVSSERYLLDPKTGETQLTVVLNSDAIEGHNANLREAAQAWKDAAAKGIGFLADRSEEILKKQIDPNQSAMQINGSVYARSVEEDLGGKINPAEFKQYNRPSDLMKAAAEKEGHKSQLTIEKL